MIDREKLEAALKVLECTRYTDGMQPIADVLAEAARAHLATLPKVKTVTRWHVRYSHRACNRWALNSSICDTEDGARDFAKSLACKADVACIEVVSFEQKVPA